jgi:hypothetical protein
MAPGGNPDLLFPIFLVNRILSGTAEAAASGADEALAYDALKEEGLENKWGKVLEVQTRFRSIAFIFAMTIGAAVYDPELIRRLAAFIGISHQIDQGLTLRFPLFMTLGMAVLTLWTTLKMSALSSQAKKDDPTANSKIITVRTAFRLTFQAGKWIVKTHYALALIIMGLLFDGIIRMVITLSSQYYRLIQIPEALFGVIGSAMAIMGIVIPSLALKMATLWPPAVNLVATACIATAGLMGMSYFMPYYGLAFSVILVSAAYFIGFFISYYLNRITDSGKRATVLSFKGLSYNLAYGFFGILYSLLFAWIRQQNTHGSSAGVLLTPEDISFISSFIWFPWAFAVLFLLFGIFISIFLKGKDLWRIE